MVAQPSISGTHTSVTAADAAVTLFSGVTVADANSGAMDTVTIHIVDNAVAGRGTLSGNGLIYNGVPNPAPGGVQGPGAGIVNNDLNATYHLEAASPEVVTAELDSLIFTPPKTPGATTTTGFNLTVISSAGTSATDSATSVTNTDPAVAPAISGTHATATTSEAAVNPFSGVTVADANIGATDTIAIALNGSGGTLSGNGLTKNGDGSYTLAGSPGTLSGELSSLTFTPVTGAPHSSNTTNFTLTDTSSAGTSAIDSATSVTNTDPAVAPAISGTHATATTSEAAVNPFSGVTVADANIGATDTIAIVLIFAES